MLAEKTTPFRGIGHSFTQFTGLQLQDLKLEYIILHNGVDN